MAIKAVYSGQATEQQGKRALDWIMQTLCRIGAASYCPGDETATAFNEGKRFCGITIAFFISAPVNDLRLKATGEPPEPSEQG